MLQQRIMTIAQLTGYIKTVVENDEVLQHVTVRGEISNFYAHTSGHLYFTLKDASAQIKSVMFRSAARLMRFQPENGMGVIVTGSIGIYTDRGEYQLYVQEMQPDGVGALHLAYEQLKNKLAQEGLFAELRKKPIPRLPRRIGVITSPTGAAIRDIISIIRRRFPYVQILIAPAIVQGAEAPSSLVQALALMQTQDVDVIIMGRGGGSIEDLWAFNEEVVARAIYASSIPVISAVGHETDFTIADFVADLRAPTPSAAAELAVASFSELSRHIAGLERRLEQCMTSRVKQFATRVERVQKRRPLQRPEELFQKNWQRVDDLERRIRRTLEVQLKLSRERLKGQIKQLDSLSPLHVLARGYSLTAAVDGQLVKSVKAVRPDDPLRIRLADGSIHAKVTHTEGERDEPERMK